MFFEGVIASAPDADRRVMVTIPTFHPDQPFGPCPYMPRGSATPTAEAKCLVWLDETGVQQPWVVAWDGPDGGTGSFIAASEKAAANGVASLDANTRVPNGQLGTGTADATKFLRGDRTWAAPTAAAAKKGVKLKLSGTPSAANGRSIVSWATKVYDDDAMTSGAGPWTLVTIKTAGRWLLTAHVAYTNSTAGSRRRIEAWLNGVGTGTLLTPMEVGPGGAGTFPSPRISEPFDLAVNDQISIATLQDTGGSLAIDPGDLGHFALTLQGT